LLLPFTADTDLLSK